MCVLSMVHDHYAPMIPSVPFDMPNPGHGNIDLAELLAPRVDLKELAKLIAEFKEAVKAAKTVDRLTMKPDCVDPEKAKLQERVAELEKRLADIAALVAPTPDVPR